jgi:release factor glutamine methyltransferase
VFAEEEAALLHEAASSPAHLDDLVAHRCSGVPLEHLVGWAEFRGLRVVVAPGVFVPRRRTGLLAAIVHDVLVDESPKSRPRRRGLSGSARVVVDLCCGSGAVGAAVLAEVAEVAEVEVYAADVDPVCVACARRNLPMDRVFEGDLYAALPDALRGRVDVLVANAPYVPTEAIPTMPPEARDHEPRVALDGGTDGLDVQRRIIASAPTWLSPGGHLVIETGRSQAAGTVAACADAGLHARVVTDDYLAATAVVATRP